MKKALHQWLWTEKKVCGSQIWWASNVPVEKAMAPHSSTLAWKIPWAEEPGGLQSVGSLRVRHYWATSLSLFTFMHWRRKWQPTPVFLPRESQGRGSLVVCRLWGRTESDTTEDLAAAAMFLAFWGPCPSYVRTIKLFCGKTPVERDWGLCFLSPQKLGKVINVSHCFKPPSFGVIRSLQKDFNSGLCHHLLLPTVGEGDSVHTSQPCFSR